MKNLAKSCVAVQNRIGLLYLVGGLLFAVAALFGILFGSTILNIKDIFAPDFENSPAMRILLYVRLPRTFAALFCGAALAVSGAVIQNVLGNKLASPSVIGVNAGAGVAVTLCTAFGIYGGWLLSVFSFLGAFVTVILVSLGAKKWGNSKSTIILMGVALNSLLGAVSDTIITFIPDVGVISNDFKIGEFSAVTSEKLFPAVIMILATIFILLLMTNELDILALGEDNAKGLGMNTSLMRVIFLILAALLAGCAVSIAGLLSFVGLIVPHIVRRVAGNMSSHLVGLCALFGGGFVCLCDTLSRTAFSPYEIPVGIIMAFLGAPFFLFILFKRKGEYSYD